MSSKYITVSFCSILHQLAVVQDEMCEQLSVVNLWPAGKHMHLCGLIPRLVLPKFTCEILREGRTHGKLEVGRALRNFSCA